MSILAIYNPVCGNGMAKEFFEEAVIPLFREHNKTIDRVVATESMGHAGTLIVDFMENPSVDGVVTIILGSGDGTLYEILNTPSLSPLMGVATAPRLRVHLVLVPCGTANALYSSFFPPTDGEQETTSYRLKSVQSFIDGTKTKALTLGITSLTYPSEHKQPHPSVSAVVVSTALHASILNDSEALRKDFPGTERFQIAAKHNIARWYQSRAKLLPAPGAHVVQIYDPAKREFVAHEDSYNEDPSVDLQGPFAYFLSTVNVDRLEPAFQITPLQSRIPPMEASFDIVVVRPLRDPSIDTDTPEGRAAFAEKSKIILGAAYQGGVQVDMRYDSEGNIVEGGNGPTVVEYIRCGGWEWIPDRKDDQAHLVCMDGSMSRIDKGGRAVCTAIAPHGATELMVHI